MNKQELIEYCESLKGSLNKFINGIDVNKIIKKIEQLEDPKEKVTLPRPVANWISCVRGRNKTLHFALENAPEDVNLWFCEDEKNRQNIFADAWVNGYHIEKEKEYTVQIKATLGQYLGKYYINNEILTPQFTRTLYTTKDELPTFTREELEQTGFGWVFDCPGMEVEEVEE